MQQQASYKQVHAWTGKVLTTVHIGQSNFSEGLRNRLQLSEYTCRVFFSQLGWNNGRWLTHPKKAKHFFKTRSYIKAEVQQNKSLSWDDRGAPTLSKRVWVIKYEWQWVMFTWRLYVYQPQGGAWSTLKCKQGLQSLSVIDAVMGVGGGGRVELKSRLGLQRRAGRLSTTVCSSNRRGWNRWKES